jgi:SM-20-related protein
VIKKFDQIITSFIENQWGFCAEFLPQPLIDRLRNHLLKIYESDLFLDASIGIQASKTQNQTIRNDKIKWLSRSNNHHIENEFLNIMDDFVVHLNATCFTGITNHEFHFCHYEKGNFYKKHLDQFKGNNIRAFSIILYLNPFWKESDGGKLKFFIDHKTLEIAPKENSMIFFNSQTMEHEVLETHVPRLSITGWLRRD